MKVRSLALSVPTSAHRLPLLASESAWQGSYEGNSHLVFCNALADWNGTRKALGSTESRPYQVEAPYLNVITMVQSSGTGKSRTIYEVATHVFTIPINLRREGPSTSAFESYLFTAYTEAPSVTSWFSDGG